MHNIVSETASVALAMMILTCVLRYLYIFGWKIKVAVETTTHTLMAHLHICLLNFSAMPLLLEFAHLVFSFPKRCLKTLS